MATAPPFRPIRSTSSSARFARPMKVVYFDCPSGASGDMILGALVDVGVSLDALRTELAKLPLGGDRLTSREVRKGAFRATKVDVEVDAKAHHQPKPAGILPLL